jgi:hypothetical protein
MIRGLGLFQPAPQMSSRKRCSARRSASHVWHSSADCPVLLAEIWVNAARTASIYVCGNARTLAPGRSSR